MRPQLKNSILLGISFLLISFTPACSQKKGLGLQGGGMGMIPPQVMEGAKQLLAEQGLTKPTQRLMAQAVAWLMEGRTDKPTVDKYLSLLESNYNLRPAHVFREISSGARMFAEGDQVYLTGSGEGFGIFSFSAGYFMSGKTALEQGLAQGANLFSSTNVRSVRSMAKAGNYLFVSSDSGLFQFDVSNPNTPYIYRALPNTLSSGVNLSAFQWNSMVYEPQTNRLLGFQGNQLFSLRVGDQTPSASSLGFNIGCGRGAASFRGKIYVAGCNQLWVMNADTYSGGFQAGLFSKRINAQSVAAGGNYLYVYHLPVRGSDSVNARAGIYVFDENENQVNFINLPQLQSFTVSGDDRFIIANDNDARAAIFRIPWTR